MELHFTLLIRAMDFFLITLGVILVLAGLVGCIIPMLPGPPLAFVALILLHFTSKAPFDTKFLLLWAGVTTVVSILDYWLPVYGTKKTGGTAAGTRGAIFGLVIGLFFFPPFGLIVGPFVGALSGEMLSGQTINLALRSALGSFLGFLAGTLMKLAVTILMGYHFLNGLIG